VVPEADVETLAAMLRKFWKHDVAVAYDGISALEKAEEFAPQLVLLDIGLPGLSGYEVAKRLRERGKLRGTYLVALTGWLHLASAAGATVAGTNIRPPI